MKIPFYISYSDYTSWIANNFSNLQITDGFLFLGFILINIAVIFLLIELLRIFKFVFLFIKNCVYR